MTPANDRITYLEEQLREALQELGANDSSIAKTLQWPRPVSLQSDPPPMFNCPEHGMQALWDCRVYPDLNLLSPSGNYAYDPVLRCPTGHLADPAALVYCPAVPRIHLIPVNEVFGLLCLEEEETIVHTLRELERSIINQLSGKKS